MLILARHGSTGFWPEMLRFRNPQSANPQFLLPDALGSVRQVTDGAGWVTDAREWTPYGVEVDGAQEGLGYTGEWQDAGVGLQYLRARWYDAYLNQFISPDPVVPDYRNPQSINGYLYAFANPVNYRDPSGETCLSCEILGAANLSYLAARIGCQPRYCPDTMSYAECYQEQEYIRVYSDYESIREDEFLELQYAVHQKLQNIDPQPGMDIRSSRWYFDTPFWNGPGIPDYEVCFEGKCCKRSEVNYFAQGMWGAASGETLEETHDVVEEYKKERYGKAASDCVVFWTTYGYEAYGRIGKESSD